MATMMTVILKIPSFDAESKPTREELCKTIPEYVRNRFYESLSNDDEVYLADADNEVVFGGDNPNGIKLLASNWNEDIRRKTIRAIGNWLASGEICQLDSPYSYALKREVMAADNCFYPFSEKMAIVCDESNHSQMQPLIPDDMLNDLLKNTADYCTVVIFPK